MTVKIAAKFHFTQGPDFICLTDNRLPNGYSPHSHDYIETVIAVEGSGVQRIDGRPYDMVTGDVFVIQGNTEHSFENTSPDFRVLNIMLRPDGVCFPFDLLRKMPGYQALYVMEPAQRIDGEFKSHLRLSDSSLSETLSLFRRMEEELSAKRPGFECILQSLLLETVVTLSREYSNSTALGAGRMLKMGEAVAWMETNYASEITIPGLARMAALSERQFLRLFRKVFGHPPLEHLLAIRVNAAAQLLKNGASVSEAAFACGFTDASYFAKQFRRFHGVSPKAAASKGQLRSVASRRDDTRPASAGPRA